MNILLFVLWIMIFALILAGVLWIGFYVVLPLVLLFLLISFISSLAKNLAPQQFRKAHKHQQKQHVIDVEFEEIK